MTVLVTGGAGFIGSNFVHYWVRAHPDDRVVVLDKLTYAGCRESLDDLADGIDFVEGDIGDTALVTQILDRHGVNEVVNFAAESHNSLAIVDPVRFFQTNVSATVGLLEAARAYGRLRRFHHVSTCEVYGDLDLDATRAFTEEDPYRPRTPYNAAKAGGDHAVRSYHFTYGVPITITNCANNYGPFQFPEKLIPLFVSNALRGKSLPLYASKENRREWIHVDDHCRAIDMVLAYGEVGETYHVGTGVERSVEEIADAILVHLGIGKELKTIVPDRPSHDRRYLLDATKIQRELGWEPEVAFADGLGATIDWYRDNPSWWEPLLGRVPVAEAEAWHESR
ncbi:MAG: dTDP-glucose 4,6-dehydratase [Ferrimicrobium sp.]